MAPRLTTAMLALLGAAVLGTVSTAVAAAAGRSGWMIPGVLSLAALACLILAMVLASARPIVVALALLGAAWLLGIPASSLWRSLTPVAGGWLLAVAELAYWSLDFKVAGDDERTVHIRRAATIAALVGASVALALVPELNIGSAPAAGVELTATGLLGAAALVGVAAALAWRLRPAHERTRGTAAQD